MTESPARSDISRIIAEGEGYRRSTLNLQASENVLSPDVKEALSSDFASRYSHIESSGRNSYGGTSHSERILEIAEKLACDVYGSAYAEVRPIGGHIAALASILTVCKKGDRIIAINGNCGGYPGYGQEYIPDMLSLTVSDIPYRESTQEIMYEGLEPILSAGNINAIILGQSLFVRPYDLRKIREMVDSISPETSIVYDASHVMGLIAGGEFQPDALNYSDILFGSTHKSFFGPQGGIILSNSEKLMDKIRKNLVWKTMDNYHPNRVSSLALALSEMKQEGRDYAKRVVSNSRDLGSELEKAGIGVKYGPWYSYSHQIILDNEWIESAKLSPLTFSELLEKNGIIVDRDGRIGTSEISHMGITNMKEIASLIAGAVNGENVGSRVESFLKND